MKQWTVQELAVEANVTDRAIVYAINRGKLQATKFGWAWAIPDEAAQEYIKSRQEKSTDKEGTD